MENFVPMYLSVPMYLCTYLYLCTDMYLIRLPWADLVPIRTGAGSASPTRECLGRGKCVFKQLIISAWKVWLVMNDTRIERTCRGMKLGGVESVSSKGGWHQREDVS